MGIEPFHRNVHRIQKTGSPSLRLPVSVLAFSAFGYPDVFRKLSLISCGRVFAIATNGIAHTPAKIFQLFMTSPLLFTKLLDQGFTLLLRGVAQQCPQVLADSVYFRALFMEYCPDLIRSRRQGAAPTTEAVPTQLAADLAELFTNLRFKLPLSGDTISIRFTESLASDTYFVPCRIFKSAHHFT